MIHSWVEYKDLILETNAGAMNIKTKDKLPFGIIKDKKRYGVYPNVTHKHKKKDVKMVLPKVEEYLELIKNERK